MNKFRASYSVLSKWASGDYEEAVKMYFKLDRRVTREMEEGRKYHEAWADYTRKTGCIPQEFGGFKLQDPQVEIKAEVEIEPWLDLVGIIDVRDGENIRDYKTGIETSEAYASEKQLGVYGVLSVFKGWKVQKGHIHHYNQYTKKPDYSFVWLTDNLLRDSHNWIVTMSAEMFEYLRQNNLFNRLETK